MRASQNGFHRHCDQMLRTRQNFPSANNLYSLQDAGLVRLQMCSVTRSLLIVFSEQLTCFLLAQSLLSAILFLPDSRGDICLSVSLSKSFVSFCVFLCLCPSYLCLFSLNILFGRFWNIRAFLLSAISKSNCCSWPSCFMTQRYKQPLGVTSGRFSPSHCLHAFLGLSVSLLVCLLKKTHFVIIRIITSLNKRNSHSLLQGLFKMNYFASHSRKFLMLGALTKPQIVPYPPPQKKIKFQSWRL